MNDQQEGERSDRERDMDVGYRDEHAGDDRDDGMELGYHEQHHAGGDRDFGMDDYEDETNNSRDDSNGNGINTTGIGREDYPDRTEIRYDPAASRRRGQHDPPPLSAMNDQQEGERDGMDRDRDRDRDGGYHDEHEGGDREGMNLGYHDQHHAGGDRDDSMDEYEDETNNSRDDGNGINTTGIGMEDYHTSARFQYDHDNNSNIEGGESDSEGASDLYFILEHAVPRDQNDKKLSSTDAQYKRTLAENTWDRVREWLVEHPSSAERAAAATFRGQSDWTPLHLLCKMEDPPEDCVRDIVEAASEVVAWVDKSNWLPLHHTCVNGASWEVLNILCDAYPEGKIAQDNHMRSPLHFYATRNAENADSESIALNVEILCDTGAAELADSGGMLPMHYACAYGTNPVVLAVLKDAYPESVLAREHKGRTPMHFAMVNAVREACPGVITFLLENGGKETINVRDGDWKLPLHLLVLTLRGLNKSDDHDKLSKRANVVECLKIYLSAKPRATDDFLKALQDLPNWACDVAVVTDHVKDILNEKIIQPFPHFFLLWFDVACLLSMVLLFKIIGFAKIKNVEVSPNYLKGVIGSVIYFFLREVVQLVSLFTLGNLYSYLEITNVIDIAVIALALVFSIQNPIEDSNYYTYGVTITIMILWFQVIVKLKKVSVSFSVLVEVIKIICYELIPFLVSTTIIIITFAQMFYFIYLGTDICPIAEECSSFRYCTIGESFMKTFTGMTGEVDETTYSGEPLAQLIYVMYALLVVILLSNVLIAIVTDSYDVVQKDRAIIVFWTNRLEFIAEMDALLGSRKRFLLYMKKSDRETQARISMSLRNNQIAPFTNTLKEWWQRLTELFNPVDDFESNSNDISELIVFRFCTIFILILWVLLGLPTFGLLWPPQVRKYLMEQKYAATSRAEIERKKLEQIKGLKGDLNKVRTEIMQEMVDDRNELSRIKTEVEAVHNEVMGDIIQVKELMSTLLAIKR